MEEKQLIPSNSSVVEQHTKEQIENSPSQETMERINPKELRLLKLLSSHVPDIEREFHFIGDKTEGNFRDDFTSTSREKYNKLKDKLKNLEELTKKKLEQEYVDEKMNKQTKEIKDLVQFEIGSLRKELKIWFAIIIIGLVALSFVFSFLVNYLKDGNLSPEAIGSIVNGVATIIDKVKPK
jgi:hypothetical protein